jgi:uncharacterized cupin superfamily protein
VETAVVVFGGGAELVEGTVELTEDVGTAVEGGSGRAVVVAGWIVVRGAMVVEATGRLVVMGMDVGSGPAGSGASS